METYEIIDRLCAVTNSLSEIVRKQAEVLAQADIAEEVKKELDQMRNEADTQLDTIEYKLRKMI